MVCLVGLAGCGSSTTTSSTASPQQTDNQQRDIGYVRAVNQIMAPFSKPPPSMTDYLGATRRLKTAMLAGLSGVKQPRLL